MREKLHLSSDYTSMCIVCGLCLLLVTVGRYSVRFLAALLTLFFSLFSKHQQQVAQAVERAKQVTMAELNAIIGVRGLPGLPPTVCITGFHFSLI